MTDFDPSDVIHPDVEIAHSSAIEFEFDDFVLRRERHHWEIQYEDEEGEQGIIIEREDFVDGKFEFDIDEQLKVFLLEDFDRIEKFAYKKGLVN